MRTFLILSCSLLLCVSAWGQETASHSKGKLALSKPPPLLGGEIEILHPDPSWCGPRVLYFFSCYFGKDHSLDEILSLCKTNEDGYTFLLDLVNASRSLDLEPTPISCSAGEILEFGRPAIICVLGRQRKEGRTKVNDLKSDEPVLHFVGLVGREDDHFVIFNPGLSTGCFKVSRQAIENDFTGHAILLRDEPTIELTLRFYAQPSAIIDPPYFQLVDLPRGQVVDRELRISRVMQKDEEAPKLPHLVTTVIGVNLPTLRHRIRACSHARFPAGSLSLWLALGHEGTSSGFASKSR